MRGASADGQRLVHQETGKRALFPHLLDDPRAQHFKQARDDDHDCWPHVIDIGRQLVEPLGKVDLAAKADRQKLAAGMFVSVAERQEGEENLIAPAEILGDNPGAAIDVAQDGAVVLAHAARCPAGSAGVDDAGKVLPGDAGSAIQNGLARRFRIAFEQGAPVMEGDTRFLLVGQGLKADDMLGDVRTQHRGKQGRRQLPVGDDHRARTRIFQDVKVIALRIGRVGRNSDAARRHDAEIGQAPFGPVFRNEHHPVAGLQPKPAQALGDQADLPRGFPPTG